MYIVHPSATKLSFVIWDGGSEPPSPTSLESTYATSPQGLISFAVNSRSWATSCIALEQAAS